jgi:P27 family predicted phage terminase small subunit
VIKVPAGRKPIPNNLKVLHGNPGKRPINQKEPKPAPIAPKWPQHLDKEAKKEWKRITPELEAIGLLTRIDMAALAAYCQSYSRWVEAEKMIRKHGMLVKTPNGYPQVSPFLVIVNKSIEQMKSFLTEFGMTPSSRSRINVEAPEKEKDDMESLLSGVK